ncbi:carotenoid biosynthesis protein [Hydrotalea sp.]|uniref:carotenoid biosynthesis protein n=1 Tax=Hydrotalea sp. TaxID=2881279 RepID=UPI00260DA87B|nr:carotenoid biosynthesis protein [Hydrotalea sp.]
MGITNKQIENVSVGIALLVHVSGALGILFTPYKDWFVAFTPLNLLLMLFLLIANQRQRNRPFWIFAGICFAAGMVTEMIGVHTGWLFGHYQYGTIMGPKLAGVPLMIGVYWFVIVFCSGTFMRLLIERLFRPFSILPGFFDRRSTRLVIIFDGAIIATCFDLIMEPTAIKLGFWQWDGLIVPVYNYVCWFVISLALLILFQYIAIDKKNHFAVHLLIIQLLFFLALSFYL